MKVYQQIAHYLQAIANCERTGNVEWRDRHREGIERLMSFAPSGSGIDSGVKLLDISTPERLCFSCDFHHMHESGMYDGWTQHVATVTASLIFAITVKISGRNRNDIKDHLDAELCHWLLTDVDDLPKPVDASTDA